MADKIGLGGVAREGFRQTLETGVDGWARSRLVPDADVCCGGAVVHGATATAELIFTEFLMAKQGDAPRVTTQGREYATFVKVKGQWRYKTRQIKGGTEPPEGWKE